MRRVPLAILALVLALLLGLALFFPTTRTAQPDAADGQVRIFQVDTSAYPQVSLFAAVGNPSGQLRTDLSRADFQLLEDGVPVDLTGFVGPGGSAISTALVIDRSGSMEDAHKIEGAREAANAFVNLLRPGDHAALISFNDDVQVAEDFTDHQSGLHTAINRLRPNGGTALYDSIVEGVDLLREQPGRRVLLVLTDGQDCREPGACPITEGSSHSLDEAITYATEAGQAVYVVGLGERGGSRNDGLDEDVLRQIATGTSGSYFYSPDAAALADLYKSLAGNLQREYQLTYRSPRPFYDGTRRDIQITVDGITTGVGYTERHLINVTASPLVGAALLLPLLGLLFLPGLFASRRRSAGLMPAYAAPGAASPQLDARPSVIVATPEAVVISAPAASDHACVSCAAPLRPGARFCGRCGVVQPALPSTTGERRMFCDMCGRPLLPGASFCAACGEPARSQDLT